MLAEWMFVLLMNGSPILSFPAGPDVPNEETCIYLKKHMFDKEVDYMFEDGKFGAASRESLATICKEKAK